MTTQKPSLDQGKLIVRTAITELMRTACNQSRIQASCATANAAELQASVDQLGAYMRGIDAGQRWLAESLFRALERDGFVAQTTKPSLALYIIEAVLTLEANKLEMIFTAEGELH